MKNIKYPLFLLLFLKCFIAQATHIKLINLNINLENLSKDNLNLSKSQIIPCILTFIKALSQYKDYCLEVPLDKKNQRAIFEKLAHIKNNLKEEIYKFSPHTLKFMDVWNQALDDWNNLIINNLIVEDSI